jgi:hypothetical protein
MTESISSTIARRLRSLAALAGLDALPLGCRDSSQPPWDHHVNVRADNITDRPVVVWARHDDTGEWREFIRIEARSREYIYFDYNYKGQPARAFDAATYALVDSVEDLEDGLHWSIDGIIGP